MGSTSKRSNLMAYFVLVSILLLLLSCGVDAAESPVSLTGDQLTIDASATGSAIKDGAKTLVEKTSALASAAKAKSSTPEAKAKREEIKDSHCRPPRL